MNDEGRAGFQYPEGNGYPLTVVSVRILTPLADDQIETRVFVRVERCPFHVIGRQRRVGLIDVAPDARGLLSAVRAWT